MEETCPLKGKCIGSHCEWWIDGHYFMVDAFMGRGGCTFWYFGLLADHLTQLISLEIAKREKEIEQVDDKVESWIAGDKR